MIVHLVDGTYELFRHFYGRKRGGADHELGAASGVVHTVLETLEGGATHIGVATDHVIESFRNALWAGYKDGSGVDPALLLQFEPLEEALVALGVVVWPMVELEADDALAAAARVAAVDDAVDQVRIWTPDKDLAQCVVGSHVVQVERRAGVVRDADGVRKKFGVDPARIPDLLALVGDSADGFPGIAGIGKVTAARLIGRHGALEEVPDTVLDGEQRRLALLFRDLATLRSEAEVIENVDQLCWRGPTPAFAGWAERLGDRRLLARALQLAHD